MKGVIVYKSRYGATTQYANWLGEILHFPVYESDELDNIKLNEFDCVIAGTSVYIGNMLLAKWLKSREKILSGKKLFLFVVCGTPPSERTELDTLLNRNISPGLRERMKVFFMKGRMIKSNLSLIDRVGLRLGASLQKDKTEKERMLTDFDDVRQENLKELLNAIKADSFVALKSVSP
jgi:menaquinone-dependent protoporphyrinogen IX oxidase